MTRHVNLPLPNTRSNTPQYKAHFSLWAALKSPLLMGNDLRTLSANALTILNNPAVIAINQDPEGRSISRVRRETDAAPDKYGIGEIQVWSGYLYGGDQVVVLLNAGGKDTKISATLAEIFLHEGPEGSAPQIQEEWDVYDLWANRMDADLAQKILDADEADLEQLFKEANWYNSTGMSYKDGLKKSDPRLLGKRTGRIIPGGSLTAKVNKHSAEMFRLRSVGSGGKRKVHSKDEL